MGPSGNALILSPAVILYPADLNLSPTNVYEYGLSHPTTVPGNISQILSATKSSTHLFLVGLDCSVNVPLTMLTPDDQYLHLV